MSRTTDRRRRPRRRTRPLNNQRRQPPARTHTFMPNSSAPIPEINIWLVIAALLYHFLSQFID